MPTRLLVLPCAGQEDGNVDLAHQQRRVDLVTDLRGVVRVVVDLGDEVRVLQPHLLVVGTGLVALVGALLGPVLSEWLRLFHAGLGPLDGEAGVQDAAGIQGAAIAVIDHRERSDGGQARRLGGCHEQLADAGITDSDHAHLVVGDPRLSSDGLDDVVAVGQLGFLEEAIRPTRAAGAAHVDTHVRVTESVEQLREGGVVRIARGVARILDDGRVWTILGFAGQRHRGRECGAVANGDVTETGSDFLLRIEGLFGNVRRVVDGDDVAGR